MYYVDKRFLEAFTQGGTRTYVELFPTNTYKKFGEIVDAFPQGVMVKITKSDISADYEVGKVYFFPMATVQLKFVTAEEAK